MILGIGTDIIEVYKFIAPRRAAFIRSFTEQEQEYCNSKHDPAMHYAARWAAKEATVKAFCRLEMGVKDFSRIEIIKKGDVPYIILDSAGPYTINPRCDFIHLTMSHTREFATATVLWERRDN